jgi:hypothetical protein
MGQRDQNVLNRLKETSMTRELSRRTVLGGVAAFVLGAGAQDQVDARQTTGATPTGDAGAVQLLSDAAATMSGLETFRFSMVTTQGETVILEGFTLDEIAGAIRRPDDFQTTVTVAIPFATIDLTAVSIDREVWIEFPAFGENSGGWTSIGSSEGVLSLLNPDLLILEAVPYVENAAVDGSGDLDGVPVTFVTGTVDFQEIAGRLAGGDEQVQSQIAEGPVRLLIAIDEEGRVREIEMSGPLLAAEANDVVRLVTFSAFNEPVEIIEPDLEGAG